VATEVGDAAGMGGVVAEGLAAAGAAAAGLAVVDTADEAVRAEILMTCGACGRRCRRFSKHPIA
jgi:hypothetical protein